LVHPAYLMQRQRCGLYPEWLPDTDLYQRLGELTGHDLMCFCPLDRPGRADVLLELANP
jgi:hypothetical protein